MLTSGGHQCIQLLTEGKGPKINILLTQYVENPELKI